MSDEAENVGSTDFSKMKVNDLKKLLKSRGLSIAGVKQDLIDRLQSSEAAAEALLEGSEVGEDGFDEELDKELDESALMADEEHADVLTSSKTSDQKDPQGDIKETKHNEAPVPSASPKLTDDIKESSNIETESQNGASEAESQASKQTTALARRAERFSLTKDSASKPADSSTGQTKVTSTTTNEVLKRRAERFGILSPAEIKRQHLEKLQARKMRFQQSSATPSSATAATTCQPASSTSNGTKVSTSSLSLQERKRLRAERFKINT
ncbi:uncharacterized protein isoform X2 [Rhodnius prolixus]|uniref:uncharacterized protein isoform X2 n=1 Tax=Rhodnius prolixus TaxID=13249 RepID=UPI003D18D3C6